MKIYYWAILITLTILLELPLKAQNINSNEVCGGNGLCCGTDPTPAGVMISHAHEKNEWMFSYRYMNMAMSGVMKGSANVSENEVLLHYNAAPKDMRMNMHMIMGMYGLNNRLTLMGMFNYNSTRMRMTMRTGNSYHSHSMSTAGIGDVKLNAIYAPVKQSQRQLLLCMGVSLPIGSINYKGNTGSMMYPLQRYPYNMQAGTGTFDLQPCVSYLAQYGKLVYSVQANATIRTGRNLIGYQYGNELAIISWGSFRWLPWLSSSLRVEGVINGGMRGNDPSLNPYQEIAANAANYGSQKVNGYIGSVFQSKRGFLKSSKFCVEFCLPLYLYYTGYQMKNNYNLLMTYNLNF